jgi:hypothetical protein
MARNTAKNPSTTEKETAKVPSTPANTSTSANTVAPVRPAGPTHEQIARRAYEIFQARGGQPGNPEQDWHQAERELRLGRQ